MGTSFKMLSSTGTQQEDFIDNFDNVMELCQLHKNPTSVLVGSDLTSKLDLLHQQLSTIANFAPKYDSKLGVKANGFRTFIKISATLLKILTKIVEKAKTEEDTSQWTKNYKYWIRCLDMIMTINSFLLELNETNETDDDGSNSMKLFPSNLDMKSNEKIESLSLRIAGLDCSPLYGRGRGFHYEDAELRKFTAVTTFGLVNYADLSEPSMTGTVQRWIESKLGLKYLTDPDFMAKRVCEATKELPVEFVQNFYSMSEGELLGAPLRRTMGSIATNHVIHLQPEPLKTIRQNEDEGYFQVPIPSSHIGQKAVRARLLSPYRTVDMIGNCKSCFQACSCKIQPSSDAIFFHMHGGGFIAQTSKSHQSYLRQWSRNLGLPIFSIDYSLAPQAPYPRALEEIFYAYNWMLQNFPSLGTNGKYILVGGDSAGGNFSLGLTMMCLKNGIRPPDSLLLIYPSLLCQMYPSPSRLISLFDPLVMFPFLMRCLNSYADPNYRASCPRTYVQELESCQSYEDPLLSPLLMPEEYLVNLPPVNFITTDIDPCLDEVIAFSNRLVDNGKNVTLDVLSGMPHGFLSLNSVSKMSQDAVDYIGEKLRKIIQSRPN